MQSFRPVQCKVKHWYIISSCLLAALFCCPSTGGCTPRCAASWVLVMLSVVCLPAKTGSPSYKWLLCILQKISYDFHLSMQLWVHRKFSITLNLFFIFQRESPMFKMTEIAYHWQTDQLIAYCFSYFCKLYAAEDSMTSQNPSSPILHK